MDVHVHHEVPSQQTPTLLTVPVSVISESSLIYSTVITQSIPSFTPLPPQSTPTPPPTTEATNPNMIHSTLQVTALVDDHLDARLGATREMVKESLEDAFLAKESSQPQSSYEAAATLTEFELKMILIDKMDKSESYLAAPEHRECYEGLIKSYDLDKTLFSTYGKVYSLKRSRKDKDKDEDPLWIKTRVGIRTSLNQKSSGKYVSVRGTNALRQDSINLRNQSNLVNDFFSSFLLKNVIDFDEFDEHYNMTSLLLKGTRSNYAELEYDFEECYKALSEKLDWENPEGGYGLYSI
ncbi:hypothetical protein Tco_0615442 [Tanacetum coccineum]